MTCACDLTTVCCTNCGATGELILKHNRQGFLTHAWLPEGWQQAHDQTLCPNCSAKEAHACPP